MPLPPMLSAAPKLVGGVNLVTEEHQHRLAHLRLHEVGQGRRNCHAKPPTMRDRRLNVLLPVAF